MTVEREDAGILLTFFKDERDFAKALNQCKCFSENEKHFTAHHDILHYNTKLFALTFTV